MLLLRGMQIPFSNIPCQRDSTFTTEQRTQNRSIYYDKKD